MWETYINAGTHKFPLKKNPSFRISTSIAIREIKITLRFYLTPVRMASIKKQKQMTPNAGRDAGNEN
ncbi:hypothetical protein ACQP3D_27615, partial [Escherichia coli]